VVIDTSAILAWLKHEAERDRIVRTLEAEPNRRMSAISLLEAQIVIRSREHPAMMEKFHKFLGEIEVVIVPFDEVQAQLAANAFKLYGKGQGHPARLNLGDCAVYALAKSLNEPLLFVGNDFKQTDIAGC
jgi:ribonuclease VapC